MRPLHLIVEGLACFREKQEIDFRRLELFAISGPTGAGKSTLLDAMIFALYGEIPRVNLQSRTEMISAARDRAAVVLDFEVGDSRYRIARVLKRNGVQMVRLEQRDGDGVFQGLADQVRSAADRVVQILGLEAGAFMQAVVLPQGEFASFLKAPPRDRRGMLRTLLRLDVYERMRERAQRLAAAGKGAVEALQKLLSDEYEIDPAAVARLEAEHARIALSLAALRQRREETQAALARARVLHARTRELRQVEVRQAAWRQEAQAVRLAQARIEAAARATPLLPLLDEAARAFAAARTAKQAADEALARSGAARRDWQAKQGALAAAAKAGKTIGQLRARVARLHRVAGRLPELEQLAAALARQQQGLATLAGERTALATRISQARAAQARQRAAGKAALRIALASGYDPALDELLQRQRDHAVELGAARRAAAERQAEIARRRRAAAQHAAEAERLRKRAASARSSAAKAQRACVTAEEALHHAISLNEVNHLRERLLPGRPCPVCEQVVATPPPVELAPAVEAARAAVVAARQQQAAADALARQSEAAQTREQAMLDAARQGLAELVARHGELRAGLAAAEAAIRRALGERAPQGGGAIEAWIERQIVTLGKRRQAHDEAQAQRASAERALEAARTAEDEARERLGEKDASLARLKEERDAGRGRLRALAAEIRAVTRAADPAAEAAALEHQVQRIEGARQAAAAEEAAARNRLAAAEEARKLTARAALSAAKHALKRVESRDARIVRAGFADEAAVRAALLDEAVVGRLAEQVQRHLREGHAVDERRAALAAELGSKRVSDPQLERIEKRAAAAA
ncbi:MAG: SMC family ATPase, partial [Acidobacteria bacterium]|nr:SMC family ATPase [Acidobacteriota bacterium]